MNLDIYSILKKTFGYDSFRPNQESVINHVINGGDALVIMPTGGGKSLCFQIPALASEHLTIVVSPLIALMTDQVLALQELGVEAAAFNSTLSSSQAIDVMKDARSGKLKILYVSPEKLNTMDFQLFLQEVEISLFAVDESHCVSVWGNDFRPDYITINRTRDAFPEVPFIALTATADSATQKDICEQLHLKEPEVFVSSFERTNLLTSAMPGQKRIQQLHRFIIQNPGCGIVYCLSRKGTQSVSEKLNELGYRSAHYHAGMPSEERQYVQGKFLKDEIDIICATIAFGMGIDKSNIRWVAHYNMPKNIEGYYQEIGRAGRDGEDSATLLFYSFYDFEMLKSFVEDSEAKPHFKQLQLAKLDRMWEFSTTSDCRTNVILNYFGEFRNDPCGHCDNCLTPPVTIDGTRLAQMALSAIIRCKQELNIDFLIGVLRGSYRNDIKEAGFTEVKTFGIGRDNSAFEWKSYITQFINKGLIYIDYTDRSRLKVTKLANDVLKQKVLVNIVEFRKDVPPKKVVLEPIEEELTASASLFNKLRTWRKSVADTIGKPPFVIFHDATLKEMASKIPKDEEALSQISGVGEMKLKKYGDQVLDIMKDHSPQKDDETLSFIKRGKSKRNQKQKDKIPKVKSEKGIASTYMETHAMLEKGESPEQIAAAKGVNVNTIYNHLAFLYRKGKNVDLYKYVDEKEVNLVQEAIKQTNEKERAKVLYDFMEGEIPYYKIRLAVTLLE